MLEAMKKVIFFVPHEDDELLVGGALIANLAALEEYEVYVYVATNGDYYPSESRVRIQETLSALSLIGVPLENIYFGGYGDEWRGDHIYNSPMNDALISHGGLKFTYLDGGLYDEWHYIKNGEHCLYTRKNYLEDLVSFIDFVKPYVVVGVDMDSHADHRCLSLCLDEAMKIVIEKAEYATPLLLKKYAYAGMLGGKRDLFLYPTPRTCYDDSFKYSTPFFCWSDRIAYKVPGKCNTLLLRNNVLYKMAKLYRTQNIKISAERYINGDVVYWQRQTNDIAVEAEVIVSSGDAKWINDYKLIDTKDVRDKDDDFSECVWRPEPSDYEKKVQIELLAQSKVGVVNIYFVNRVNAMVGKASCRLLSDEGNVIYEHFFSISNERFVKYSISLERCVEAKTIEVQLLDVDGEVGISEIEVYEQAQNIPFEALLYDTEVTEKKNIVYSFIKRIDGYIFEIVKWMNYHLKK